MAGLLGGESEKEGAKAFECFIGREEASGNVRYGHSSAATEKKRGGWIVWGVFWMAALGSLPGLL